MEWRVLGSVEVTDDENEPIMLGGPKQLAVLALLLVLLLSAVWASAVVNWMRLENPEEVLPEGAN